ncbi:putative Methyltransferase-like protein 25 [Hypsibius exemplaris]|uniref:Methyltransferase-like protein 25 n=1 Tax=Hypsibius exemplaris TaxID=2072580 RepID=A0A1W0X4N8_HYPEX|nr:putative Methyltransferase-like protein 25 [Hypsibius exemplaris]
MSLRNVYQSRLEALIEVVLPLRPLLDARMAKFYSARLWRSILPEKLSQQSTSLRPADLDIVYDQLLNFCRNLYGINGESTSDVGPPKNEFEVLAYDIFVQASALKSACVPPVPLLFRTGNEDEHLKEGQKLNALFMMSAKKYVEVEDMSFFVSQYARLGDLHRVVDFGSGKGYLSAMLNMRYGLSVLGLELSSANVAAARVRTERMIKQWSSLCRSVGLESKTQPPGNGSLVFSSCEVTRNSDLDEIVADSQSSKSNVDDSYLLCGLHTCGSLGNDLLDIFRRNSSAKALVAIGCCYHFMAEAYSHLPEATGEVAGDNCLFPMSSYLNSIRFSLGRTARMLASQSPERILLSGIETSVQSMFFRAVLQELLGRHGVHLGSLDRVGKIDVTGGIDFVQYVAAARRVITIPSEISDDDARACLADFESLKSTIAVIILIRVMLAPCLEQIVLLDRALFLLDQKNVADVHLVSLFSPVVSPRTWAICAYKN